MFLEAKHRVGPCPFIAGKRWRRGVVLLRDLARGGRLVRLWLKELPVVISGVIITCFQSCSPVCSVL